MTGMRMFWTRRFGAALVLPAALLCGCATGSPPATGPTETRAMEQRFIVRYQDDSAPGKAQDRVADAVSQVGRQAGVLDADSSPQVTWLRRLAVGADVVSITPALDASGAQRLLEALNADPDVVYAEPDSVMTIGPGPRRPALEPTGD